MEWKSQQRLPHSYAEADYFSCCSKTPPGWGDFAKDLKPIYPDARGKAAETVYAYEKV